MLKSNVICREPGPMCSLCIKGGSNRNDVDNG